jgi:hypoxanthine-DNA glycosylase
VGCTAQQYLDIHHPFAPVFDSTSRVLVLGTFPSVQSRANAFYYGHPQNRFWPVLAALFGAAVPSSVKEKTDLLLTHHVALWDVLASCDIAGSADGSIRNPVPNDLSKLLGQAPIHSVFTNGQTAAALYRRWSQPQNNVPMVALPSTSPANARCTLEILIAAWKPLWQSATKENVKS